jgi:DNA-binding beta-propeller fold protein YncE
VANSQSNDIYAYAINALTGALTPAAGSPFAAGNGPASMTVTANGEFAYVVNYNDNTVSAYGITAATGALTPVAGSPFATGAGPASVVTTMNASVPVSPLIPTVIPTLSGWFLALLSAILSLATFGYGWKARA